ncbi:MAG: phage terminase large subunit family protein [Clostridiales bacterium]|nr:phage terminase large subunit family protein [Clostridiales bacterium]
MKKVSWKAVKAGWALAAIFSLTFIGGSFNVVFYLPSIFALIGIVYLTKTKLRCPHCGEREKLERLTRAKKQEYHCSHCGELIEVDTKA